MNRQEQSGTDKQAAVSGEHQAVSVGEMLRQLRKEKGISIRDAAKETNISASNLVAIEHENYTDLPANTFIRGQVAIYANLLGIDGNQVARRFIVEREQHQQIDGQKGSKGSGMSAKQLAEPAHVSAVTLAVMMLMLIGLFVAGFFLYTGWNPFSYLQREQTPTVQVSPAPELETVVPPAAEEMQQQAQIQENKPVSPGPAEQSVPPGN
ncbi:helix-turn-helix domain-containing protein [Desulfobulbus sp. F5]|nr:helix-turn-helix domain-containing protein [Desulfobulbus sp. F5]